eukprot:2261235-Rhodomonas_salina.1
MGGLACTHSKSNSKAEWSRELNDLEIGVGNLQTCCTKGCECCLFTFTRSAEAYKVQSRVPR